MDQNCFRKSSLTNFNIIYNMNITDNIKRKRQEILLDAQSISRSLTNRQKEVIRLLQNKEFLITNKKGVFVTCGNEIKKITMHSFYNIVNKGLVCHQTEWPFNYVLSDTGKIIKV